MTHPNDMTAWDAIACRRGHGAHAVRLVEPAAGQHGYRDLPQFPPHLRPSFSMLVWPPEKYPVDGGPYCPAHDAVSETIVSHGAWEPIETQLVGHVVGQNPAGGFLDVGAQLGWFSLYALQLGAWVVAIEADAENAETLRRSAAINSFEDRLNVIECRVGPETFVPWSARAVKIDVEGAEPDVVAGLGEHLDDGTIEHLLIEVSPVFHGEYPAMIAELLTAGFDAYLLPGKSRPPVDLRNVANVMDRRCITDTIMSDVHGWHQENVWFKRRGVSW